MNNMTNYYRYNGRCYGKSLIKYLQSYNVTGKEDFSEAIL